MKGVEGGRRSTSVGRPGGKRTSAGTTLGGERKSQEDPEENTGRNPDGRKDTLT